MPKSKKRIIGYAKVLKKTAATAAKKKIEEYCKTNDICKKISEMSFDLSSTKKKERSLFPLIETLTEDDVLIACKDSDLSSKKDELLSILEDIKTKKCFLYILENGNEPSINKGVFNNKYSKQFAPKKEEPEIILTSEEKSKKESLLKHFLCGIYGDVELTVPIVEKDKKK